MPIIDGIGAIAGNFAEGYRQARAQKNSESLAQEQRKHQRAIDLMTMADHTDDPKMKDTLFSSATEILDALEAGKPQKLNQKGVGSLFGKLFGIGHHTETPAPSQSNTPYGPPVPPGVGQGTAPAAVSPDSNTFGGLGGMFGQELQAKAGPMMKPAASPEIPAVPDIDLSGVPTQKEIANAATPFAPPTLTSPRGTPVTPPVPAGAPPQQDAPPAQRQSQAIRPPMAEDVIAHAKVEAEKQFPNPMHTYQRRDAMAKTAKQNAAEITRRMLDVTDQHLASTPGVRTTIDASNNVEWGPDFRSVMATIGSYEDRGLIDKGTLARWEEQHFQKAAPWDPQATKTFADGSVYQVNPVTGKFDILVGAKKEEPKPTFEQDVDAAFSVPEKQRTAQQANAIAGYLEKKAKGDRSTMSPSEQVEFDWLNNPAIAGLPIATKAQRFQNLFHPLQPSTSTTPGVNPTTGKTVIYVRKGDKMEPTEIGTPGPTFIPERYQRSVTFKVPTKIGNRTIENEERRQVFSADALIAGHASGDVTLDTLSNLLKSGAEMAPGDEQKVSDYINRQLKPKF